MSISLNVVRSAAVFWASLRRSAIRARIGLMGTASSIRSPVSGGGVQAGAGAAGACWGGAGPAGAVGMAGTVGIWGRVARCESTSSLRTRPPGPVGVTSAAETPCSAMARSAAGITRAGPEAPGPFAAPADAAAFAAGAAATFSAMPFAPFAAGTPFAISAIRSPTFTTSPCLWHKQGDVVKVGDLIAEIAKGVPAAKGAKGIAEKVAAAPAAKAAASAGAAKGPGASGPARVMPAAERAMAEHGVSAAEVTPTGPGGRVLKEDVLSHLATRPQIPTVPAIPTAPAGPAPPQQAPAAPAPAWTPPPDTGERIEEAVPMSPMRARIAERLKDAQNTAALLTTFNEIDMTQVVQLREELR